MVRSYLAVAGISVTIFGLASIMNCGGTTEAGTGAGTTSSGSGATTSTTTAMTTGAGGGTSATTSSTSTSSGSFTPVEPPPAPTPKAPDGTTGVTMAISKLYLGDTDPDGTPDQTNGWEFFGYNIDNVNPADAAKFCKTVDNASPAQVHMEGKNGIENSFGHNILPIVLGIASDASTKVNDSIAAGTFTIMLDMEKLGTGTTYNPVVTQLFGGANCMCTPDFSGSGATDWPVVPELLNAPMTAVTDGSTVQFPMSYVTNNTWVSGSKGMLTLQLSISGFTLSLNIANAVITMNLNPGHTQATGGMISGVLPTSQLTQQIQEVAGSFDMALCSGATICSILSQIEQASDIMADGTQDPTKACDGISIGLGFDAALVANPDKVADPAMPKANPCGDAGTATCQ